MRTVRWIAPLVAAAAVVAAVTAGCKKKQDVPAPVKAVDAAVKDISTGAGPAPRPLVELGEPVSADPDGAAGEPALAVGRDGKPLLAWIEAGKVHVRRWSGTAWDVLAAPPNAATHRATGAPSLAVEADGGVVVGWLEANPKDVAMLEVARWRDGAWTQLGVLGGGQPVADPIVTSSALGPIAVWREALVAGGPVVVNVRVHGGNGWAPLGDGVLRGGPDGTTLAAPALGTSGAHVIVGWVERSPVPVTQLRRWDAATSAWTTVPGPEGADNDSTLALAVAPDGVITVSLSFHAGLRQLVTRAPGAEVWKKIDVAELSNGFVTRQRLIAAEDGRAIFTYPYGGRFAWWDGKVWFATPVPVVGPSTVVPAAAAGPGGVVYVGWSAARPGGTAKVRVVEVKQQ